MNLHNCLQQCMSSPLHHYSHITQAMRTAMDALVNGRGLEMTHGLSRVPLPLDAGVDEGGGDEALLGGKGQRASTFARW